MDYGKYLDPKADLTFKKVFGEHEDLVMSLLNALLPLDEGKHIEHVISRRRWCPRTLGRRTVPSLYGAGRQIHLLSSLRSKETGITYSNNMWNYVIQRPS